MTDSFYFSREWLALRARVLQRDGNRCTVAWLLGGPCRGDLHVHHIEPREEFPELALEESNCGTACASHHSKWDSARRAIIRARGDVSALPPCGHKHPYPEGRAACDRRRARELGLFDPIQLGLEAA